MKAGSRGVVLLGGWAQGGSRNAIAAGALAYYQWLNAHGGVYGRAVSYNVLDDHGSPQVVSSLVHQLVQNDAVFAVFGPAAVQPAPAAQFLAESGVPDVFAGSACLCAVGQAAGEFGWFLTGQREGKILGAWVAQHYAGQKVAVLYGSDQVDRTERSAFITAAQGKVTTTALALGASSAAADAVAAKEDGAKAVVALAPQRVTSRLAAAMRASKLRVPLVAAASGLADGLPSGVITDGFLPSAGAASRSPAGSWIALFRSIRASYLPHAQFSPAMIDGMSAAYEMAAALFGAGQNLTRPGLITAMSQIQPGPAAAPLEYTAADPGGPEGAYIGMLRNGSLMPMTGVEVTSDAMAGSVMPFQYPQQSAPASGIPSH